VPARRPASPMSSQPVPCEAAQINRRGRQDGAVNTTLSAISRRSPRSGGRLQPQIRESLTPRAYPPRSACGTGIQRGAQAASLPPRSKEERVGEGSSLQPQVSLGRASVGLRQQWSSGGSASVGLRHRYTTGSAGCQPAFGKHGRAGLGMQHRGGLRRAGITCGIDQSDRIVLGQPTRDGHSGPLCRASRS
jgi:hypothetical protein